MLMSISFNLKPPPTSRATPSARPLVSRVSSQRRFTDFIQGDVDKPPTNAEDKADQLIARTALLLKEARQALDAVKQRAPLDSRNLGSSAASSNPTKVASTQLPARPRVTTLETTSPGPNHLSWSPTSGLGPWFTDKLEPAVENKVTHGSPPPPALLERDPSIPAFLQFKLSNSGAVKSDEEDLSITFESELVSQSQSSSLENEKEKEKERMPQGDVKRSSGESFGPNGYWYRWTEIEGKGENGEQWSERWWEASDWGGTKELGASKWGVTRGGDAWRETWREALIVEGTDDNRATNAVVEPIVEREAHKWARKGGTADGATAPQEWEERWHEKYWSLGKTEKSADKWGRQGDHIWHERWGESYDGAGGCLKWTDRWAEANSGKSKWGDKWEERFSSGQGTKKGETWSVAEGSSEYHRWWGETHFGNGQVQKYGHSTEGEQWDVTEPMDTYYNPIPHFGYAEALQHSPQLRAVAMLPRDELLNAKSTSNSNPGKHTVSALDAFFGRE